MLDPQPDEVDINDIAHSLSLTCRFGGHSLVFYSVAEHCVRASHYIQKKVKHCSYGSSSSPRLAGILMLLHDSPESYCCDICRPLKRSLPGYEEIEDRIFDCILTKYDLKKDYENACVSDGTEWKKLEKGKKIKDAIKEVDEIMLNTEKRDLMGISPKPWNLTTNKFLPYRIVPYSSQDAERLFLEEFHSFFGEK